MTRYVRNMLRSTASRSPSQTPSGSPTILPTAGTAAAPSYKSASPNTQRHPMTRQCPSESRPQAMTQRASSTSIQEYSKKPSQTTTPTPSTAAVTATSQKPPCPTVLRREANWHSSQKTNCAQRVNSFANALMGRQENQN